MPNRPGTCPKSCRLKVTTGSATAHSAVTMVSTSASLSPDAIRCPGSRQTASYSSASAGQHQHERPTQGAVDQRR